MAQSFTDVVPREWIVKVVGNLRERNVEQKEAGGDQKGHHVAVAMKVSHDAGHGITDL